ncbi:MAG: pyruvate kinase [Tepidisphaera sp.]
MRDTLQPLVPSVRPLPMLREEPVASATMSNPEPVPPMLAKIVATIGPASDSAEMVRKLIEAGVSVFRFNFSHGDFAAHGKRLQTVRTVAQEMGRPVACLGDLQGPKIRVGKVPEGGITVEAGHDVIFRIGMPLAGLERQFGGDSLAVFPVTYEKLISEVEPGHKVLVNDGAIRMLAVERNKERGELRCRVIVGGLITSGKGINLPQSNISAPAITDRDWECARWAVENDMDYVALSFVRRAEEVTELKERLNAMALECRGGSKDDPANWVPVVAKIEKPQALADLDRIVQAADGVMVARGDLGVEMDIARVPVSQKEIVAKCAEWGKPCIVATQMLETMIENAVPTRAEASDVANAIFDGADAVMLSAETATGKHPALVVSTMRRIVSAAETRETTLPPSAKPPLKFMDRYSTIAALAHGAWHVANDVKARAIVVWSQWGGSARYLSQNDFHIPIVAYSSSERATRRMALFGNVTPVLTPPPASGTLKEWNEQVDAYLIANGFAKPGDKVVLLAGKPLGVSKVVNSIAIHTVGEAQSGWRAG